MYYEMVTNLYQFVSMFLEDLGILLNLCFVTALSSYDQDKERDVGLQEGIRHMINHRFTELS